MRRLARANPMANPLPAAALRHQTPAPSAAPLPMKGGSLHRLEADAMHVTRSRKSRPPTMAVTATLLLTTRPPALPHPPQSLATTTLLCLHEQSSLGRLRSHRLLQKLPARTVTMNSPLARRVTSLRLCVVDLSSPSQAVLAFGVLLARLYPTGVRRGTRPSCPRHGSASGEAVLPPSPFISFSR